MGLEECQIRAEAEWIEGWRNGPQYIRWDALPVQVGDRAPEATVLDSTGKRVSLSSLWAGSPALILFWRHYGCGCGLDRNRRLQTELEQYRAFGANVTIVGQGEPEQAAQYAERYEVPVPILSDPDRTAYRAFAILEGLPSQILFDASQDLLRRDLSAGLSFASERKTMGRPPVNSPWQLPAEFVVDATGVVRLAYRYQHCEDFPDHRVITATLDACRV